jgi:hypothetical protein
MNDEVRYRIEISDHGNMGDRQQRLTIDSYGYVTVVNQDADEIWGSGFSDDQLRALSRFIVQHFSGSDIEG